MALPSLATVEDLAVWVDEPLLPDDPRALAVLRMASARVRSYTGRTWVDADSGELTDIPEEVWSVVVQVAARGWLNPTGIVQDTTGPFTVRYPEEHGQGIFLTDSEKAQLDPYRQGRRSLWTQRTTHEDPYLRAAAASTVFIDAVDGGDPVPWFDTFDIPEGDE